MVKSERERLIKALGGAEYPPVELWEAGGGSVPFRAQLLDLFACDEKVTLSEEMTT